MDGDGSGGCGGEVGREAETGTQEDPGGGVSSGLGETTPCDVILIPLSEAVQSGLLPPGPPSPPGWLLRRPLPIG